MKRTTKLGIRFKKRIGVLIETEIMDQSCGGRTTHIVIEQVACVCKFIHPVKLAISLNSKKNVKMKCKIGNQIGAKRIKIFKIKFLQIKFF